MPTSILQKFSTHLRQSLRNSFKIAVELRQTQVTPMHFFYGLLLQKGSIAGEILAKNGLNKEQIIPLLINRQSPSKTVDLPDLSEEAQKILLKAAVKAAENGHHYIGTEHLLLSLLEMPNVNLENFFKTQKVAVEALKQTVAGVLAGANRFPEMTALFGFPTKEKETTTKAGAATKRRAQKNSALDFFTLELTSPKIVKTLDPIIGRETEINRVIQILCRRAKNNPVLLGDPGVGKTAIVEGLAQKISAGNIPDQLQDKKIRRLDLGLLVAGTIYRGEFEGRLKQLLEEIKADPNIILFIDELHTIVGAGSAGGTMDAANLLKPSLARGELRCIGATTFEEFKKHIESDAALERRFQPVLVNEPSREETIQILQGIKINYEKYHLVKITDEAIIAAVDLTGRYRQDKFFPDKAIDLLDEAAAAKKLTIKANTALRQLKTLQKELEETRDEKEEAVLAENFEKALLTKEKEEKIVNAIVEWDEKNLKKKTRPSATLTAPDVAKIIAQATGLPISDLVDEDKNRLRDLEKQISQYIIGQEEAVAAVAQALRRARLGLTNPNRPLASFLFAGPSGVGKTALAKTLARLFFKDKESYIRLDMSEFGEGFHASKLIGSPAGYVGYKDSNKFTDKIKTRPHSVILFDEIDKAHPEIFNLLLQILDEGHLTDATGKKINFKNTVIIMTTNFGQEHFTAGNFGFHEAMIGAQANRPSDREAAKKSFIKNLKEHFRPEFVNRLDSIIIFQPLSLADLEKIIDLQMTELNERLAKQKISMELEQAVRSALAQKARELDQGARGVAKVLQTEVEEKITEWLLRRSPLTKQQSLRLISDQNNQFDIV